MSEADAKYLMNNPAWVNAVESARKQVMDAALACDPKDDEGRRRYLDAARTVDKVVNHIRALAATPDEQPDVEDFYKDRSKSRLKALIGL